MSDMWGYPQTAGHRAGNDLTGYKVEATDGAIGKVDKCSDEVGSAYLVVDIGIWIFGKHVLLPAGTVKSIDVSARKVYVSRTKEEIKDAPEFDKEKHLGDAHYHQSLGAYYQTPRNMPR
ncbi:PRC-barrel domain-containing protein [Streptomyces sp. NPDC058301]|uniref:PRC-barrel domain-containing protein n=1 Tax=Streptomyces sp. NPDC058301 TaxID=3346436 RepID=UPI0036EF920F